MISLNYDQYRAVSGAHSKHVRLLGFQECALCGYPPVENEKIEDIDFSLMDFL